MGKSNSVTAEIAGAARDVGNAARAAWEKDAKGNVAKALKTAAATIFGSPFTGAITAAKEWGTNHPEWYTHISESNLVNMNLATKQNVAFENTAVWGRNFNNEQGELTYKNKVYLPAVASILILLTVPEGDQDGWKIGVRRLYQQLRTANSGKINFTVQDLEKYILNVRAMWAISSYLDRLYRATYSFMSTNSDIPFAYLHAMGADPEDIMAHASNLFTYVQRYVQQVRISFPLNCDLLKRTIWLFSNIFKDSNGEKSQYYVPTLNQWTTDHTDNANGIYYFTSRAGSGNTTFEWTLKKTYGGSFDQEDLTYTEMVAAFDAIKADLIDDQAMSLIAGDIIKAFGDRAFMNVDVCRIDSIITPVYDENVLCQLQNANVLYNDRVTANDAERENRVSYREFNISSWVSANLEFHVGDDWAVGSHGDGVGDQRAARYNNGLVNWHKTSITPGEVMSITRFYATDAHYHSTGENSGYYEFNCYGTEVVCGVFAICNIKNYDDTNGTGGLLAGAKYIPIGGVIEVDYGDANTGGVGGVDNNFAAGVYIRDVAMFCWALFDWAPKLATAGVSYSDAGAQHDVTYYGPDMLDWDIYAQVDSEHVKTYFSYGNQSLLYAGESQNQSNTKVYKKNTRSKGKGKNSGVKGDDKAPDA